MSKETKKSETPHSIHEESRRIRRMKKMMAWTGIIILAVIYLTTFIVGVFGSPASDDLFKACIILTVVVPVLFWAMIRIAAFLEGRGISEE